MKKVKGGISAPKGFLANALRCGIKKEKNDLAFLFSQVPATASGVFTKNKIKAAPVIVSRRHIRSGVSRGVIVNSGNANCCNGERGVRDANLMAAYAAKALNVRKKEILVASTGVIGRALPMHLIKEAVPDLVKGLRKNGGRAFAEAIMTTDSFRKEIAVKTNIAGSSVVIGGAVKGAGMIYPDMATMLSFITTDAAVRKDALDSALKKAAEVSFNSISVDGSMSTNDSVFVFANGLSGNSPVSANSGSYVKFCEALEYVMRELAEMIVLDGEGATKFIRVDVKNAKNSKDARKTAASVANDTLFKTSAYGQDPNWGRIIAAVGASGSLVDAQKIDVYLGGKKVVRNGAGVNINPAFLRGIYRRKRINVTVDLKLGKGKSTIFTSDLTKKYLEINSAYTS